MPLAQRRKLGGPLFNLSPLRVKTGRLALIMLAGLLALAACDAAPTGPGGAPAVPTATLPVGVPANPQPQPPAQNPVQSLPSAPDAAAIVNGVPIPLAAYQRQVDQYQAALVQQGMNLNSPDAQAQLTQLRQLLLDNMIDDQLIAQEAAKEGVSVSDADLDAAMQQLIDAAGGQAAFEQTLAASGQTLDDARQLQRTQMLNNLMRDRVLQSVGSQSEQVHARHILVDSPATAEALLAQIQAGADFGDVARQSSMDTLTKASGGDLGWFPRGVLVSKEVEDAAFALQPGQISPVIKSEFGYHLVQTLERDPARTVDPDTLLRLQQQAIEQWLNRLRAAAQVQRLAPQ